MALLTTNRITEQTRVLSRIYHLGEKSLVAEGDKPLRGVPQIPWIEPCKEVIVKLKVGIMDTQNQVGHPLSQYTA